MRLLDPNEELHPLVKIARECYEGFDVADLVGIQEYKHKAILVGADPYQKSFNHLGYGVHLLGHDHIRMIEEIKLSCAEIVRFKPSPTEIDSSVLSRIDEYRPVSDFIFDSLVSFPVTPAKIETPEENFQEIKKKKSEFHQGISKRILKQRRRF